MEIVIQFVPCVSLKNRFLALQLFNSIEDARNIELLISIRLLCWLQGPTRVMNMNVTHKLYN